MAEDFDCPSCGAPLQPAGAAPTVKCPYCGDTVAVPAAFRPPVPAVPRGSAGPVFVMDYPISTARPMAPPAARRRRGCSGSLFLLVTVLIVAGLPLYFNWNDLVAGLQGTAPGSHETPRPRATSRPPATPTAAFAQGTPLIDGSVDGTARWGDARALAVDSAGTVYVTDSNPGRILLFSPTGQFLSAWSVPVVYPSVLRLDRAGNAYTVVSDAIRKFDARTGALRDTFSFRDTKFGFFGLGDLVVLADGSLLATIRESQNLLHLDATGKEIRRFTDVLAGHTPGDEQSLYLAVDPQGYLLLLGRDTGTIYRLTPDGQFVARYSGKGDSPSLLENPDALAVDSKGRMYVADSNGIQVFDPTGRYLGTIKTDAYATDLVIDAQDQVLALENTHVVRYRLNGLPAPPVLTGVPATMTLAPLPTATPVYRVGSTVPFEGWVFSVARVETHPTLQLTQGDTTLTTDGRFVLIWLDARNTQTRAHSLAGDFRLELGDQYDEAHEDLTAVNADALGAYLRQESRDSLDLDIPPNALTHPLLIFGLPDGTTPEQLVITSHVSNATLRFTLAGK